MNNNQAVTSWLIRFIKGIFIGSGFILPGVSGGALATVFGLYERMIMFLSHVTKNFKENFFYFLPVGLGGVFGVFIFSVFLNIFFVVAERPLIWFFIGCIAGTLPALWMQAGQNGRNGSHLIILTASLTGAFLFLRFIAQAAGDGLPLNAATWLLAGALIALGSVVPGLSTSNLLLFLQMYRPMTEGISSLNWAVIIPIGIGGLATVLLFSKVMAYIFKKAYGILFHTIIGFVLASTVMIIPHGFNYASLEGLLCAAAAVLGAFFGRWMTGLEARA